MLVHGDARAFTVPADGYIAGVKVAVDAKTGLIGELLFIVKSNTTLVPTNVVSCGAKVGLGFAVTPALSAVARVSEACRAVPPGRRLRQASTGLALDPATLSVTVTTVDAPAGGAPPPPPPPPAPRAWKLAAVVNGGDIWTSADGGATWTDRTAPGSLSWFSIASSADGSRLAAVELGGDIWTSTDGGTSWTDQAAAGARRWNSIASSADGSKLAAVVRNDNIWTSVDGGATWTDRASAGSQAWRSIASSADGSRLAAAVFGGDI